MPTKTRVLALGLFFVLRDAGAVNASSEHYPWLPLGSGGSETSLWRPPPGSAPIPKALLDMIDAWPARQAAERAKGKKYGKFVTMVANRDGLGNRMGPIAGAVALAVTTGRALEIEWPRRACETKPKDCDPTSINDLFEPPPGVSWKMLRDSHECLWGKSDSASWIVHGNEWHELEGLHESVGLWDGARFRESLPNLCMHTDRCTTWAVSCNEEVEHLFPTPWIAYGVFLDYIFSRPKLEVRRRVQQALQDVPCALGIHLRKENGTKFTCEYDVVESYAKATRVSYGESTTPAVYVAADEHSKEARALILSKLDEARIPVIEPIAPDPTRMTFDGMFEAVAENLILSTCVDILPKRVGSSTFHDVAAAHSAFLHDWPQDKIRGFVRASRASPADFARMKHSAVPADCYDIPEIMKLSKT